MKNKYLKHKFTFGLIAFILVTSQDVKAQNSFVTLSGLVTDSHKNPLKSANITVKNDKVKSTTDENGNFSINSTKLPLTLVVSNLGFSTKELEVVSKDGILAIILEAEETLLNETLVTSRRRQEVLQEVPIPIAVVSGKQTEEAGAFNVNRVKELVPSVQLYSSNPRNTTLNIRGLGSTFGLTNDGIDPGVGFYVDGVYFARPAATTLDFIDIERIEVLRGPQGTLFGKNTTAGAFNVVTRKPTFISSVTAEVSYGNYGFVQAKTSINGALLDKVAGRLSFSGTQRDGVVENVSTGKYINDLNNLGFRGQLLFDLNDETEVILAADYSRQRPDGFAQVIAGVVTTQRAGYRQFNQIIADLGYELPSLNAFDRKIDHDTQWKSGNDLGGVSLNIEHEIGKGKLTSTTAWRFWDWDPSNDRDFTGLPVLTKSQATSKHQQWSQEIRYAGDFSERLSGVFGVYLIGQDLKTNPYHLEESGAAQWRFSQNTTSDLWQTPGLFEGYGIKTKSRLQTLSAAFFGQLDWEIIPKLHLLPGIRFNYDEKEVDFSRKTYGGLETEDPELLALKRAVYTDQEFKADVSDSNYSGQLTLGYKFTDKFNLFATYARNFKPVGINLGGLPTANGEVLTELAVIKPEKVEHLELGIKTSPSKKAQLNITIFNTEIKDYQTQVQTAELGVNRGYLANAEKVRVRGLELEGNMKIAKAFQVTGSVSYTEGKYIAFKNAPVPLEETGGSQAFKDISGGELPGISKWAGALGGEYSQAAKFFNNEGLFFIALDSYLRSDFSSSASPSKYLNIDGYAVLNGRFGFKTSKGLSISVWARNILNKDYFEQLLPGAGNAGHYAAVLGDTQTYGITFRQVF